MKQRVSMGNAGQAIIITNLTFDEDGFVLEQKAGILPFDPDKEPAEVLKKAATKEWELHGSKNIQGFYSVRKKRELTPEELAKQVISSTGRSVTNEVVESEVESLQLLNLMDVGTNTPSRINQSPLIA